MLGTGQGEAGSGAGGEESGADAYESACAGCCPSSPQQTHPTSAKDADERDGRAGVLALPCLAVVVQDRAAWADGVTLLAAVPQTPRRLKVVIGSTRLQVPV